MASLSVKRSIAVGENLRRILQVATGLESGAEAAVHAQ